MTTISLKVPEALDFRLAQIAEKRGSSKSELIRSALERMVAKKPVQKCSCLSIASDLIGCVDGPADLSHNKKHMKGFGAWESGYLLTRGRWSLADACLVKMVELHEDSMVMTLDVDFLIYRRHGRQTIPVLMPPE
ncbi:MAG: ribbon-helix-helix protein, CopG family [Victivallales bacterium]|jgi:hypothetical protein